MTRRRSRLRRRTRLAASVAATVMACSFPAGAVELSLGDANLAAGVIEDVPVHARDARGLAALQMTATFDAKVVEVIGVAAGKALSNALVDFSVSDAGCKIAFAAAEPVQQDGELLIIKLRRRPGATGGSSLAAQDTKAWSGEEASMPVSVKAGRVAALSSTDASEWAAYLRAAVAGAAGALVALAAVLAGRLGLHFAGGHPRGASKFCSTCGAPANAEAKYCSKCGSNLASSEWRHPAPS